jgi:hypothetical protein
MSQCFRTFIKLLQSLLELCNIKMSVAECFLKLSGINWDKSLQELVNKVSYFCFFEPCVIQLHLWSVVNPLTMGLNAGCALKNLGM